MFFSSYIFSKPFFTFWIAASFIWVFVAGGFCIVLPIWESRVEIGYIFRTMWGWRKPLAAGN